jgi:16S rRNA (uracil1498-N3)-methyltransferase
MFLFYSDDILADNIILSNEEHQHCTKVLRKKIGDHISITDGKGNIFHAEITNILKQNTKCKIESTTYIEPPKSRIAIAIAPTKNANRIEWFAEKAVEIGISDLYFIQTHRTEKKEINMQRIEKIILSAMKQSMNIHLPHIKYFKSLKDFSQEVLINYDQKFIAHCDGPTAELKKIIIKDKSALLMIGPEGDFTSEEVMSMENFGFQSVSLGSSRLRTETAGLVGLMIMKY